MRVHIPSLDEYDLDMGEDPFDFEAKLVEAMEFESLLCPDCGADWSYYDPTQDETHPCDCEVDEDE
jgi:hypothetical protein